MNDINQRQSLQRLRYLYARIIIGLLLVGIWVGCLNACHPSDRPSANTNVILQAIIASQKHIPDGQCRYSQADTLTKAYLSPELVSGLYGATARQWIGQEGTTLLTDMSIYLSNRQHPFEIAVLRCKDTDDIHGHINGEFGSVLGTCQYRLMSIQNAWQDTEYQTYTTQGVVTWVGEYVLLLVCDDPQAAKKAAEKVIKNR